ncbi:hypothetical protein N9Y81_01740, partial [Akkermansiaceae bacterium]|nr:hypothetical protein [Akkermansiaceae bacterium]
YKAFFKACELHSSKRDKVRVADYNKKGDLIVVREYTSDAAARFLEVYDSLIKRDPYSEMSSLEFCGLSGGLHRGGEHGDYCFLHGVKSDLTAEHMKQLYAQDEERLSGESGDTKHYQIMTHVLGMTPLEYLDSIKPKIGEQPEADSSKTPITQSDHEQVPDGFPGIVPPDHDSPEEDSVSFDSQFGL